MLESGRAVELALPIVANPLAEAVVCEEEKLSAQVEWSRIWTFQAKRDLQESGHTKKGAPQLSGSDSKSASQVQS